MSGSAGVDLVIVNYNSRRYLEKCLASIYRYTPRPFKIIVVDNGSTDGSVEYLEGRSDLECLPNQENLGYAAACNQGIRQGVNPYIILLNPDIEVTRGWLEPLLGSARHPKVAVVGPKLVNSEGLLVGTGVKDWNELTRPRSWMQPDYPGRFMKPEECISVGGACYLIKRALLPELGFFDERYFLYFEETDYSINALLKGFKVIFNPKSVVIHHVGATGGGGGHQARLNYFRESRAKFVAKWRGKIPCLP